MQLSTDIAVSPEPLQAIDALERAGFEAWLVGGCVRDGLLGRRTYDYDIATAATWQQVESTLQQAGFDVYRTGVKHGTVTAVMNGENLEVTTYRTDGTYSDGRHPDEVQFVSSIQEDLARRDFTMNAVAFHPERGILDPYDGRADIEQGIIRAVGAAQKRFCEDGLRILRGLRFAAQLGFSIHPETLQAMATQKMMLQSVAAERITTELTRLLMGDYVHDALMQGVDVLGAIMPEICACKGFDQHTPYHLYDVWEHTAYTVQYAPQTPRARWAALLHDIGKPGAAYWDAGQNTQRMHFFGHAELSVILAQSVLGRMAFSQSFMNEVLLLVRIHDDRNMTATTGDVLKALAALDGDTALFEDLMGLRRADARAQSQLSAPQLQIYDDIMHVYERVLQDGCAFTIAQLNVNGRDIAELGVPEGPRIGELLRAALQAVMQGNVANERDALLEFARTQLP